MNTKHEQVMEFSKSRADGSLVVKHLGRLYLADGTVVRLFLMPDGLHIGLPKNSESIHEYETATMSGLSSIPKR